MNKAMDKIAILLKAQTQCIWVQTFEEQRFIDQMSKLVSEQFVQFKLQVYSFTQGLARVPMGADSKTILDFDFSFAQPNKLMGHIEQLQNASKSKRDDTTSGDRNIFILRDYNDLFAKQEVIRRLRDIKSKLKNNVYNPIIIVSPTVDVPLALQKTFQVVTMETPSKQEIAAVVDGVIATMTKNKEKNGFTLPTTEERDEIVRSLCGITHNEVTGILMRSIQEYKALKLDAITEEKINTIKKSGVLSYKVPQVSMADIGGNNVFKDWFSEVKACFTPQAKELGIPLQKGYLALGLPGTCKSVMAEAVAKEMGVPLIALDLSNILAGLVGKSESNMRYALDTVRQMAPCVLFVDEVEKMIGGISSSNQSDSGVIARTVGALLEFMVENNEVFTIMTSNDVSQLPPELIRPGRIDAQWYFGLPTASERTDIFNIHLNKYKQTEVQNNLDKVVKESRNYTGAEIELVVKTAVRKAYKRVCMGESDAVLVTEDDLLSSVTEVVPVFKYNGQQVQSLEQYAKNRTRSTSNTDADVIDIDQTDGIADEILLRGMK